MKLKLLFILSTVLIATLVFVWKHLPDDHLHIIACDVGQGDATLVMHRYTQLLIDGGKDEKVLRCLHEFMPIGDQKIEIVIATHPDADHIRGLVHVLSVYTVEHLIQNADEKETADFSQFREAVQRQQQKNMRTTTPQEQLWFQFGEFGTGWVWWMGAETGGATDDSSVKSRENTTQAETTLSDTNTARVAAMGSINDRSIITFLRYGKIDVLLMGDGEKETELALQRNGLLLDIEVLKVGHHGAKLGTTAQLLQVTTPEIALVSAGANNTYGHPHPSVIARLEEAGVVVLRTDTEGTIELVSDGVSVWRK